jgi:hypothetical protein
VVYAREGGDSEAFKAGVLQNEGLGADVAEVDLCAGVGAAPVGNGGNATDAELRMTDQVIDVEVDAVNASGVASRREGVPRTGI